MWLAAACFFDYRRDKIPNALIGLGMLTGILYQGYLFRAVPLQFITAVGLLLFHTAIIIVVFYPLFKLGMLGAGDVKLFCLLACFLQGRECVVCIVGSLLIAAFVGTGKLLVQENLAERLQYFCSYVADVAKNKAFRLYFENAGLQAKRKASLHMAGTLLLSVLLHAGGVY